MAVSESEDHNSLFKLILSKHSEPTLKNINVKHQIKLMNRRSGHLFKIFTIYDEV